MAYCLPGMMIRDGQSYTLKQLRQAYAQSEKVFRSWLRLCMAQLYEGGYEPGQRVLTPRQVQIVVNQLGQPQPNP